MKKGMKITGIIILSFVLLVLVAAFVLPYLISLDKYKGMVEEQLEEVLQRDSSLGKLRVTILPTLGAKIQEPPRQIRQWVPTADPTRFQVTRNCCGVSSDCIQNTVDVKGYLLLTGIVDPG